MPALQLLSLEETKKCISASPGYSVSLAPGVGWGAQQQRKLDQKNPKWLTFISSIKEDDIRVSAIIKRNVDFSHGKTCDLIAK